MDFGSSSSAKRRPHSSTPTEWPFSDSRSAETLPPKPEPMTSQSKSKLSVSVCMTIAPTGPRGRPAARTRSYLLAGRAARSTGPGLAA